MTMKKKYMNALLSKTLNQILETHQCVYITGIIMNTQQEKTLFLITTIILK